MTNDIFKLKDHDNNNVLHLLVNDMNEKKLKKVLEKSKKFDGRDNFLNQLNNEGNTPLHLAVEGKNKNIIGLLLNYGANTSIINGLGKKINIEPLQKGGGSRRNYVYKGKRYL